MRFIFKILACICVLKVNAQDDCEKFRKEKISQSLQIRLSHVYSRTNNAKTYGNYGFEILYSIKPLRKWPVFLSTGIGYYDRLISNKKSQTGGFDASDWYMIVDINYRLKHLELPLYIELTLNRKKLEFEKKK